MSDSNLSIRWLESPTDAEIQRLLAVFEAAFDADHGFQNLLFDGNKSFMSLKFYSNILSAKIGGKLQVACIGPDVEDIVGGAVWFGPGQDFNGTEEQRKGGGSLFTEGISEDLRKRWKEYLAPNLEALGNRSLGPGYIKSQWYLMLFGVIPEYQGKGIGKAMIWSVEEIAKKENTSLVLLTLTPIDVIIYQRMGFQVKGQVELSGLAGDVMVYQMSKTP